MKLPSFLLGAVAAGASFADVDAAIPPSVTLEERLDFLVQTAAAVRRRWPETSFKDSVSTARLLLDLEDDVRKGLDAL